MVVVINNPKTVRRTAVVTELEATRVHGSKAINQKFAIFRTYQVIWYLLGLVEALLAFRFIFKLSAANPGSTFVRLVYDLTAPLVAPFVGIYRTVSVVGSTFESVILLAMLIYLLLAWGIVYLLQLIKPVDQAEVEEEINSV